MGGGDRSPGPWDGESYQVYTEPGGKRSQGKGKYWGRGGVTDLLAPGMEKAIKFIQKLEEKDLKEKVNIGARGRGGDRSLGPWDGESYQVYTEPGGKRSQRKSIHFHRNLRIHVLLIFDCTFAWFVL